MLMVCLPPGGTPLSARTLLWLRTFHAIIRSAAITENRFDLPTGVVVESKRESDTRPAAIERAVAALRGSWVLVYS